jgi:acyl-lipid omega-3 desaturase
VFYPHRTNDLYDQIRRFVVVFMGPAWFIYVYGRRHFWPVEGDTIFKGREADVSISHAAWFTMLSIVVYAAKAYGTEAVLYYYVAPLTMFASWLVITTFLHHSDPDTPWYAGEEWNYVKVCC